MNRRRKLRLCLAALGAGLVVLSGCGFFNTQTELLRSDMPLQGLDASVTYRLSGAPGGNNEVNIATLTGMNAQSPTPLLTTTFEKVSDTVRNQTVKVLLPDGKETNALGMTQAKISFGLSQWMEVSSTTYDFHDAKGDRNCGAKIRMNYKPNGEQFIAGDLGRGWDAIWYYLIPCDKTTQTLNIADGQFHALVITEQWTPRITQDPLAFNRGRSVTIVGGEPSRLVPGWWLQNATPQGGGILGVNKLVRGLVSDLNSSQNPWMEFNTAGQYQDSKLVYSAGDANVFWSVDKAFLNREVDYVVNHRSDPNLPWSTTVMHPVYNFEWNDWSQNFGAYMDHSPFKSDDHLDENGFPKDPNDPVLKEIETQGCQNCPNSSLEQIQFLDGQTGAPLYAMTIRGYIGAKNSLVLFGALPHSNMLEEQQTAAETRRQEQQMLSCPVRYDEEGKPLADKNQWTNANCADVLREGAMWSYLTENPDDFGFDLVGQFNVRDNGTWASQCSGSGEHTSCALIPIERKLDAVYMYNQLDTSKPWTVLQMLGEVGVRTLGLSYASDAYAGSGLLFSMAQPMVRELYFNGLGDNPELIFALDARASQLPGVIASAESILK